MASDIVEFLKLVDKTCFPAFLLVLYSIWWKLSSDSAPVVNDAKNQDISFLVTRMKHQDLQLLKFRICF